MSVAWFCPWIFVLRWLPLTWARVCMRIGSCTFFWFFYSHFEVRQKLIEPEMYFLDPHSPCEDEKEEQLDHPYDNWHRPSVNVMHRPDIKDHD